MRRFDGAPMIQPILFKSAIYWVCVLIVRLVEELVHFVAAGGAIADFGDHLLDQFPLARFLSIQIWLMVLFLVYVTIHELNELFGDGELYRLFFRWRSSEAKLTRRQRIRLLTRLNHDSLKLTQSRRSVTVHRLCTPSLSPYSANSLRRALRRRRTPDCGVVGLGRGLGFGFLLWRQGHGPGP